MRDKRLDDFKKQKSPILSENIRVNLRSGPPLLDVTPESFHEAMEICKNMQGDESLRKRALELMGIWAVAADHSSGLRESAPKEEKQKASEPGTQ